MKGSATTPSPLTEFQQVSKWYGPVIAVNDVSFDLHPGITGLVGPNGAGKSTLIKLLTGQLAPSLGRITIRGLSATSAAARSHTGYCPDVDAYYEEMSGRSFVRTMARLHGFPAAEARLRTDDALRHVGMIERADRRLATYSKGMRQRIKLAQALVHQPELVVLDEPLNGVDPVGRRELVNLFRGLAEQGKAVLVSSHILDDMDRVADRILFICRGRLLASGSPQEIRDMLDDHPLQVRVTSPAARRLGAELLSCDCVHAVTVRDDEELLLQIHRPTQFFPFFAELAANANYQVERLQIMDASTEAIFDYLIRDSQRP
jgi:ABC-2 type transport system ATP-binding protein